MAELVVREVDPEIIAKLKERAERHSRSIEDEHKAILRDVLLAGGQGATTMTFEEYLRVMPDVGADADFSRIEGAIRDVNLSD